MRRKESTILEINSTQMTTEDVQLSSPGTNEKATNKILLTLIQIFGCIDILFICIHMIICIQRRQTQMIDVENRRDLILGNISIYEDIDIVTLSNN